MLQQTRVAAVTERYGQFLSRFADVRSLAEANVSEVLALWSGLGYYRRARAMHGAARQIVAAGAMPSTAEEWRKLPGIGRYTAAAVASIAHGERCAVVDGNVERVIQRVVRREMQSADIWTTADHWISPKRPGDFNQAMMELGATVCVPATPRCMVCPLHTVCATRGELRAKPVPARKKAQIACGLSTRNGAVYLTERAADERLMPGMWELPQITPNGHAPEFTVRHSITVTDFVVTVYRMKVAAQHGRWVKFGDILSLPLTGLTRKILRRAGII